MSAPGRWQDASEIPTGCPPHAASSHHLFQLRLRRAGPRLPTRNLDLPRVAINFERHEHIAAFLGDQGPMRPTLVVTRAEFGQALAAVLRMIVQPPVHFLGLQGRVEPLQQAQLLRRAVLDPHVAELVRERTP